MSALKDERVAKFNEIAKQTANSDTLSGAEIIAFRELLYWSSEQDFLSSKEQFAVPFLNKLMASGTTGRMLMVELLSSGKHTSLKIYTKNYGEVFVEWMEQLTDDQRASILLGQGDLENGIPYDATEKLVGWMSGFSSYQRSAILAKSYNCRFLMSDCDELEQVVSWIEEMNPEQRTNLMLSDDVLGWLCRLGKSEQAIKYLEELSEEQKFQAMSDGCNTQGFCIEHKDMVIEWMDSLDNSQKTWVLASGDTVKGLLENGLKDKLVEWMDGLNADQRAIVLKGQWQAETVEHLCDEGQLVDETVRWINSLDSEQRATIFFDDSNAIFGLSCLVEQGKRQSVKAWIDELPSDVRLLAIDGMGSVSDDDANFLRGGQRAELFIALRKR